MNTGPTHVLKNLYLDKLYLDLFNMAIEDSMRIIAIS